MKTIKTILTGLFFVSAFIFAGCNKDDDPVDMPEPTNTIVDIASADANFSILVDALVKADLANTLAGSETFTVFAPTNDAFNALFTELGVSGLSDLSAEALTPILLYHVLGETKTSGMLSAGYYSSLSPAQGSYVSLYVQTDMGVKLNDRSMVTAADLSADNGVIHVIDKVLLPPTVVDVALNNPAFSILVEAVVKADLVETLKGAGPFTVFAPTNDAFSTLFSDLGVGGITDLTTEQLVPILQYHVVGDNVLSTELTEGVVGTLNGDINIGLNPATINTDSEIVIVDVQGINGVVHAITKVLLPPTK